MREPTTNIQMLCDKHAPKPDENLARLKPEVFIGKHVKVAFKATDPRVKLEHMWVKVRAALVKSGKLVGVLANDPVFVPGLKCGDRVVFNRNEIEAVDD